MFSWIENLCENKKRYEVTLNNNKSFPFIKNKKTLTNRRQSRVVKFHAKSTVYKLNNSLLNCAPTMCDSVSDELNPSNYCKPRLSTKRVLSRLLTSRKSFNKTIIPKWDEELKCNSEAKISQDSGWEEMSSDCCSTSQISQVNTTNFRTSSPMSERSLSKFDINNLPQELKDMNFDDDDDDDDKDNNISKGNINQHLAETTNYEDDDDDDDEDNDKSTSMKHGTMSLMHSKSDTEICPYNDVDDVEEQIREFTRDNPLRQSYPGMSNTTRRESCQQLLKIVLAQMKTDELNNNNNNNSEVNEDDDGSISDMSSEASYGNWRSFCNSMNNVSTPKKTMRDTLLEISLRREEEKNSPLSKGDYFKAEYLRDDIHELSRRLKSQKIIEEHFADFDQAPSVNYDDGINYSCLVNDYNFNDSDDYLYRYPVTEL